MTSLPDWVRAGKEGSIWGERLKVLEWQDDDGQYRRNNGWQGRDLIHDADAPVRVLDYYVKYGPGVIVGNNGVVNNGDNREEKSLEVERTSCSSHCCTPGRGGVGTILTGIVSFTKRAESHKGYCHGGSMCR